MTPTLVFDYDGTLQETDIIYGPAVRAASKHVRDDLGIDVAPPTEEQIKSWLGKTAREMWHEYAPQLDGKNCEECMSIVYRHMLALIKQGNARWFAGAAELLDSLKSQGYRMVILSNCNKGYATVHSEFFGMDRWFESFYDSESFGDIGKGAIMKKIADEHPGERYIVIGDRGGDMEAAAAVGAPFIGCTYGYGTKKELRDSTLFADSPHRIEDCIHKLEAVM